MRLGKLTLQNFRGFENFEIEFDPQFTVLLGGNMAGKSAVLDAARIALAHPLWLWTTGTHSRIGEEDVRRRWREIDGVPDLQLQLPSRIQAHALIAGLSEGWSVVRTHAGGDPFPQQATPGVTAIADLMANIEIVDVPVVAFSGTRRMELRDVPDPGGQVGGRADGYLGCLEVAPSFNRFVAWMRKQTLVQLQRGPGYRQPQLAAVEVAVKSCVGGIRRLWYDVQYEELRLERNEGDVQSFAMLSEGYRNTVALIANLAWRASLLNPHHGADASRLADGVVLIDEIDLHLHPSWQRRIVGDLQRTFPKIQFIVTTHSPQIVASVKREQVRLLENNRLVADALYVEGRDTNGLLEDVFGVPARPADVEAEIGAFYRLIDDEAFEEARQALGRLQERLGPDDVAIVRARWMLETEVADRERVSASAP